LSLLKTGRRCVCHVHGGGILVIVTVLSTRGADVNPEKNSSAGTSVLRFESVVKEYATEGGRVRALDGITLGVSQGSFVALMGRSGCGKSTLLNLAGAMDFPSSGEVLLDGVATARLNDAELTRLRREKVGFIFQSFQLLPTLSVAENVELPLLLAGTVQARRRALEQLVSVGLADYGRRMPHQLSGGQMQRVAISRALVHAPRLVLADEPTGNLDTTTGNSILELLSNICRERQTTILMATHSAEAAAFADTVVHMRDGHIEQIAQS
jgi:putative ABC transport system ATP-binding protein